MIKLYGNSMSTCTRKVLATLHEKQAKFEMVSLDFMKGEHKTPAHVARQPFGQMPAIEDGDFTLFESRAIIRYLDDTLPGQSLTPKDPKGRAMMEQWISVESADFTPPAMAYIGQFMFNKMMGKEPDLAIVEAAKPKLESCLKVLDKAMAKGPHLLGDQITLADICLMPYFEYAMMTPAAELINAHKNTVAWWKRVSERASWKATTAK